MVRCVCLGDDEQLSRQLHPPSRMTSTSLRARGSFGLCRSLDFVFALLLLLHWISATQPQPPALSPSPNTRPISSANINTTTTKSAAATTTATVATNNLNATETTFASSTTTATANISKGTTITAVRDTTPNVTTEASTTTQTATTAQNAPTTQNTTTKQDPPTTRNTTTTANSPTTQEATTTQNAIITQNTTTTQNTTRTRISTTTQSVPTTSNATTTQNTTITKNTITMPNATITQHETTTLNATTIQNANITQNETTTLNATTIQNANITQNETTTLNATTIQNATTAATTAITTITLNTTIFSTSIQITGNATTVKTELTTLSGQCSFHQNCNESFYWMALYVGGLFTNAVHSGNVRAWLKPVFENNLSTCVSGDSQNSGNASSASTNTSDLFQGMKVSCESNPVATEALCEILLKLSTPVDVCCIEGILAKANLNTFINGSLTGGVERVGMCLNTTRKPYNKCNSSDPCSENSTCENYTNSSQRNCTVILPTPSEPSCNCSSNCNSSYSYYRLTVGSEQINSTTLQSIIEQLLKNPRCNTGQSDCVILEEFKEIYLGSKVTQCFMPTCYVILRLKAVPKFEVCKIQKVINTVIKQQNVSVVVKEVTKVAICSWGTANPMDESITWETTPVSSADFCDSNFPATCSNGSSVAFLLNERCYENGTSINSTISPPSSTASTTTSIPDFGGLLNITADASSLNSSQVDLIITMLEKLLSGPNVSMALANTSVGIVNNLLDVPVAVMAPFSKRASGIVDTVGLKLVVSGESESLLTSALALAVKKVNGSTFQETFFSIADPSNVQIRSDSGLMRNVQVRSVPMGSVILPASLTQNLSMQDQQLASRVQFNFYQKNTFFQDKTKELISGILSASVANLSISNLQKNVTITLKNTIAVGNKTVVCAFWDFGLNDGAGGWNPAGCTVVNSSSLQQETQCSCNHLTSFGILLDLSKEPIDPLQNTIMTYITYIGCGLSSIFLSVTLLTYLSFGKLRKDIPSKILIQLCIALLLLNLVFLVDSWLAQYPEVKGLCKSTAFFLHYFLLASFTWMAMEAVHMYVALVKVFNTYISRFMLKIGFAGWGIPLVVVIIVIATDTIDENYGLVSYGKFVDGTPDEFCWITNDIVFYVAVVAYFCVVFLINFTMFIVVLIQLCRIKRQNPQNVQNRSSWQEIRSVAGLTVLLGLTWGFAFFAWGPVNVAFMYLFAIFNSLQGLFIFIYHCAMKENVRQQWRTYLCCGKMRLPENSEWSRTATQKNKKASNNSSLSFLNNDSTTSDLPMGICNPFDDRVITASEEPSSDVILNEIKSKNRGKKSY